MLLVTPLWPVIRVAAAQRGVFWANPVDWNVIPTYRHLAGILETAPIATAVLAAIVAIELCRRGWRRVWPRRLPLHEVAAGLALLLLPAGAVALGHWTHAYDFRYVIFGSVGLAIAVPIAVWILSPENGIGEIVFAGTLAVAFVQFSGDVIRHPPKRPDLLAEYPALLDWFRGPHPIAVSGGVTFLGTWYALPEEARARVVYPADPVTQRRLNGNDTVDRGYLALGKWTAVKIVPIDDYFRDHPHFYLYMLERNWTIEAMRRRGEMIERARERVGEGALYEVTAREPGKD